jgi:hypothetical protein
LENKYLGKVIRILPNARTTIGTFADKPIEPFPTFLTAFCSFLLFRPLLDAMFLHMSQIFNDVDMVRDAIDNVNILEIFQALARKVMALKTPRHFLLDGTLTKAVPALDTKGEYPVGETTIATDFLNGNTGFLRNLV